MVILITIFKLFCILISFLICFITVWDIPDIPPVAPLSAVPEVSPLPAVPNVSQLPIYTHMPVCTDAGMPISWCVGVTIVFF